MNDRGRLSSGWAHVSAFMHSIQIKQRWHLPRGTHLLGQEILGHLSLILNFILFNFVNCHSDIFGKHILFHIINFSQKSAELLKSFNSTKEFPWMLVGPAYSRAMQRNCPSWSCRVFTNQEPPASQKAVWRRRQHTHSELRPGTGTSSSSFWRSHALWSTWQWGRRALFCYREMLPRGSLATGALGALT